MTDQRTIERQTTTLLSEVAPARAPDRLYADVLTSIGRTRQRTRWLAYFKESPMRTPSGVAVGSPTFRLASILAIALGLVLALGAAVAVGASLLPTPAIVVAQDGSGTVTSITEAVAMAVDGDTVLVKPGTYLESVVITEDITLRGNGDPGTVVIEFTADGPTHPLEAEPFAYGILLDDSDAQVVNITVRGHQNAAGSEKGISAVIIAGGGPVIEQLDVILDGAPYPDYPQRMRRAIAMTGGSSAVVRDSSWDGFTELVGSANSPRFEGNTVTAQRIRIAGTGQKVTIIGNTLLDGAGIVWGEPGSSGTVEDNDIVGYIVADTGDDIIIRHNRIRGGGEPGDGRPGSAIGISGSGSATVVEGNEISDSPNGIDVYGSGATPRISGNTILGSSVAAILVDIGAAPTIDGNTIEGNATGIEVRGTATPVMTGNTLCENGSNLVIPDGSTLTLDGNTMCANAS